MAVRRGMAAALAAAAVARADPGVPVAAVARLLGWRYRSSGDGALGFETPAGPVRMESGSRRLELDGIRIWLYEPVRREGAAWAMGASDAARLVVPIGNPCRVLDRLAVDWSVVALDPGHGGVDSGAVGAGGALEEKAATLDIALRVRDRLLAHGLRVAMTREDDRDIGLHDRVRAVSGRRPFAFVSIHLNAAPGNDARGVETYILTGAGQASTNARDDPPPPRLAAAAPGNAFDGANARLGFALHRQLARRTGAEDRGLRHARFHVLRHAGSPAALVECGFVTHPEEAARLMEDAYRGILAEAIAEGVLEFRRAGLEASLGGALRRRAGASGREGKFFSKHVDIPPGFSRLPPGFEALDRVRNRRQSRKITGQKTSCCPGPTAESRAAGESFCLFQRVEKRSRKG